MTLRNQWRTIPISKESLREALWRHRDPKTGKVDVRKAMADVMGLPEDTYKEGVHKLSIATDPNPVRSS